MIDQNRDGFIDNEDLKDMLASLGNSVSTFHFSIFVSLLTYGPLSFVTLYVVVCVSWLVSSFQVKSLMTKLWMA